MRCPFVLLIALYVDALVASAAFNQHPRNKRLCSLHRPKSIPQSTTPQSTPQATGTTQPSDDISVLQERRFSRIVGSVPTDEVEQISTWISTQRTDGTWADIDYTTGCVARRANWPAGVHWERTRTIAAAFHGGLEGAEDLVGNDRAKAAVFSAMDRWFERDFGLTHPRCLDRGGTSSCPCGLQVMYNTNWYSSVILIPNLVGQTCILMEDADLTASQQGNCSLMTNRSYQGFERGINGAGLIAGANALDIASIAVDLGIFASNRTVLADAYRRVHNELRLVPEPKADGVRFDGSFGQHSGMLYNGNYGKDHFNGVLNLETLASGTSFSAGLDARKTFETVINGSRWMINRNILTGVLHWDLSAVGRMITFPVADQQASGSINMNLTKVKELGEQWDSDVLQSFADDLSRSSTSANAGDLIGNAMFYSNDYMVHRGRNYISSWKGYSNRTKNTECTNSQNPLGFHLADGTVYTLQKGNEYEDISAAWDWNLIPGITTDYGATPLTCDRTSFIGVESFVGGVSDGKVGMTVMRYTNPTTRALSWQKAWFFLDDDVQRVMVSGVTSTSKDAKIYSVLDQRRHDGPVFFDDASADIQSSLRESPTLHPRVKSLYHGGVGYTISNGATLGLQLGQKSGDWSNVGTSTQPPISVDLFAAWLQHSNASAPISYTAYPGVDYQTFLSKKRSSHIETLQNDANISAVFDEAHNKAMIAFWSSNGGSVRVNQDLTITSDNAVAMVFDVFSQRLTVADPSQTLKSVTVMVGAKQMVVQLPTGGLAGSSVSQNMY